MEACVTYLEAIFQVLPIMEIKSTVSEPQNVGLLALESMISDLLAKPTVCRKSNAKACIDL